MNSAKKIKRLADSLQSDIAELSSLVGDELYDEALRLEMAIGAFQAELEDIFDREGIEAPKTNPLRPKPTKEDFPVGQRIRFRDNTKPEYLGKNKVEGKVLDFTKTGKIVIRVDDVEEARRFRGAKASVKTTTIEKI